MKNKIQIVAYVLLMLLLIGCGVYIKYLQNRPPRTVYKTKIAYKTKIVYKPKKVIVLPKGVLLTVTIEDLKKDLETKYKFLSQRQQQEILKAIITNSTKYHFNPLKIYSLISGESSFRFWITSKPTTVTGQDGKKHKDSAVGIMSIMYSIHSNDLKEAGIISTRSELRQITPNINSGCFILNKMRKHYKGDMDKAMKAYFGINSKFAPEYLRRIKAKYGSIAYTSIEE